MLQLFLAAGNPINHVTDKNVVALTDEYNLTLHMVSLVVACFVGLFVLLISAKAIGTGKEDLGTPRYLTKGRLPQLVEVITLYLLENAIRPVLGHDADKFTPFLLSIFFFVLTCNLMGLIPIVDVQHLAGHFGMIDAHWALVGGTATSSLGVTLGLALFSFAAIQYQGFKSLGVKGWCHHLAGGAPLYLLPIMLPVELMGMIIKPVALAIRLFANMLAGHTLLAVVAGFGVTAWNLSTGNVLVTGSIELVAVVAAILISFLELFVAFLQAFIFMFLTTVFIGQMTHHHDDHSDAHGEEGIHDHDGLPDGLAKVKIT
ncbi:MAG: F0F1 ATP synthase subunit A [Phycisphaerales bacterium]|nr:F0F1 ATP synthase subunit A [Phycisphaerales bacterium]